MTHLIHSDISRFATLLKSGLIRCQCDANDICSLLISWFDLIKVYDMSKQGQLALPLELDDVFQLICAKHTCLDVSLIKDVLERIFSESVIKSNHRDTREDASEICDNPLFSVLGVESKETDLSLLSVPLGD